MASKRNVENRKAWIAALRSGKFRQTKSTLFRRRKSDQHAAGYCCLGVACRVAGLRPKDIEGYGMPASVQADKGFDLFEWLGLPQDTGLFATAAYWNDSGKLTFKEIADKLEEKLLRPAERDA